MSNIYGGIWEKENDLFNRLMSNIQEHIQLEKPIYTASSCY